MIMYHLPKDNNLIYLKLRSSLNCSDLGCGEGEMIYGPFATEIH